MEVLYYIIQKEHNSEIYFVDSEIVCEIYFKFDA